MSSPTKRVQVIRFADGTSRNADDVVVIEEPLEIRIGKVSIVVTMRTPGHDIELAAGFLVSEGVVRAPADIEEIAPCTEVSSPEANGNIIVARLAKSAHVDLDRLKRNFYATSSCGICGKASIEQVCQAVQSIQSDLKVPGAMLASLPNKMRKAQRVFDETGGLHAAALFDPAGNPLCIREDVSRHNAVDKVIGWAALDGRLPLDNVALLVSGRASFEIIQKAIVARIPIVAAVSAPSSLAVELAQSSNQTLIGFLRDDRFVIYSGADRVWPP